MNKANAFILCIFFTLPCFGHKKYYKAVPDEQSKLLIQDILLTILNEVESISVKYNNSFDQNINPSVLIDLTSPKQSPFTAQLTKIKKNVDVGEEKRLRSEIIRLIPFKLAIRENHLIYDKYFSLALVPDLEDDDDKQEIHAILPRDMHIPIIKWSVARFEGFNFTSLSNIKSHLETLFGNIDTVLRQKIRRNTKVERLSCIINDCFGRAKKIIYDAFDLSKRQGQKKLAKEWINTKRDWETDITDIVLRTKKLQTHSCISYSELYEIVECLKKIVQEDKEKTRLFFKTVI